MISDISETPDMFFSSFRKTEYERDIGEYKLTERERTKKIDDSCLCLRENPLYTSDGGTLIRYSYLAERTGHG